VKNRTQQEWRELFKQQAAGDLSVAAFCKEHGIGQSYFYKRKSDLAVTDSIHSNKNFIKVKAQHASNVPSSSIKIQHQQTRLHLPATISAIWLAEFVKALA
jgi:hypothetical protein